MLVADDTEVAAEPAPKRALHKMTHDEAWEFVIKHKNAIYWAIKRFCPARTRLLMGVTKSDLAQSVMIIVTKRLIDNGYPEGLAATTYLVNSARWYVLARFTRYMRTKPKLDNYSIHLFKHLVWLQTHPRHPLFRLEKWDASDVLRDIIRTLKPRLQVILTLRFGLFHVEQQTLEQIGKYMGLTKERVRQLESDALAKVCDKLKIPLSDLI